MDSNNIRKSKELLVRCWMTPNGMWLFYCHLFGFAGKMELNAASVGPMGMRHIKGRENLENALREILSSLKTSSLRFPLRFPLIFHIADSAENQRPGRTTDFEIKHHRIPLHKSAIPPTKRDRSFCTCISQLERFLKALPVEYSTTPSCVGCVIQNHESCLKEYRFSSVNGAKVDFSCPGFRWIDLKGVCCGTQID